VDKVKKLNLGLIGVLLISLVSLSGCVAPPPEGAEGGGFDWTMIVFLLVIFALLYFVMIRPQRKRQKQHQQLLEELRRGDKVITTGGIHGVVESISEDSVVIKVESGVTMRVARGSVAGKREEQK